MNVAQRRLFAVVAIAVCSLSAAISADRAPLPSTDLIGRFDKKPASAGEQAGVGIALALRDGRLVVGRLLPGTPAALSGSVHVGDRLVAVGQGDQAPIDVKGMSINQTVRLIRGTKGTLVVLTIVSPGKNDTEAILVPLIRGVIKELNVFGDGHLIPPGAKSPDFDAILLRSGDKYRFKSSLGKIVVVDFWASWCGPCLEALDSYQRLQKQHPEWKDRVEFIAVAIDEEKAKASHCIEVRGTGWKDLTLVWAGPQVLKAFHIASLPGLYLLDRQGRVMAHDPQVNIATIVGNALAAGTNSQPPK